MKISKASWMILSAGVFIIILAGLGMTRSGQIKEFDVLSANVTFNSARLNNLQVGQLQTEINEYQEQLKDSQGQVAEVRDKLKQTVISVDVADKFYEVAAFCGVVVNTLSTSAVVQQPYAKIDCEATSVNSVVSGDQEDIVKFVLALNDNFSTGFVRSAQISFSTEGLSNVSIQMIVYSRKGS
jgi:hypothetical protein